MVVNRLSITEAELYSKEHIKNVYICKYTVSYLASWLLPTIKSRGEEVNLTRLTVVLANPLQSIV